VDGRKCFLDHEITSIQNYINAETLRRYDAVDINVYEANLFHTKMMLKEVELQNYLFNTDVYELPPRVRLEIMTNLRSEMIEIFSGRNIYGV
jgi:S-adenosylmethionine decarboxylase